MDLSLVSVHDRQLRRGKGQSVRALPDPCDREKGKEKRKT